MSRSGRTEPAESVRHDVVVVGGGGAGLSAAIAIAEQQAGLMMRTT